MAGGMAAMRLVGWGEIVREIAVVGLESRERTDGVAAMRLVG